jgi:uncharacterized membrane protein
VLPQPALLVGITGVLELAGAAGLLWRRSAPWVAGGLTVLLVAMFPANVYAALVGLTLAGAAAMPLLPRTVLQLVFLAATITVLARACGPAGPPALRAPSPEGDHAGNPEPRRRPGLRGAVRSSVRALPRTALHVKGGHRRRHRAGHCRAGVPGSAPE